LESIEEAFKTAKISLQTKISSVTGAEDPEKNEI
jgi:hypothetical protein